jgi:hypothetical protein
MTYDKAQHEVMVIIASNVERKAASFHIKTESNPKWLYSLRQFASL